MSDGRETVGALSAKERQALFIELATRSSGITAQQAYQEGCARGDNVTVEAYHNLGRRLMHRGLLVAEKDERQTRFRVGAKIDGQWLDEEQLASIVDSDYPLIALAVIKESVRQLHEIPESVWIEARNRLKRESARDLFLGAIKGYADNLRDELHNYHMESRRPEAVVDLPKLRKEIETTIDLLRGMAKQGLGLSDEALRLPGNFEIGLRKVVEIPDVCFYNEGLLAHELRCRIANEPTIVEVPEREDERDLLVAAVDGSSRGGLLSFSGEEGDISVGHAPMVSINTSIAQINRAVKIGSKTHPAFLRLPEKPEDMQRQDNRYTIMAKLFFPDLSDSQYAHSVWNAMDVLESRAAMRVMSRWYTSKSNLEIRPADIVLRDGSIIPQDRDSNHYKQQDSYGQIVRDLIELNWEMVKKCRDDGQTLAGVVKNAQVRVLAPAINFFLCKLAANEQQTQICAWPLRAMNHLPDQVVLTRILTSGRRPNDPWERTCVIRRPFHAATDFASRYSRTQGKTPADTLIQRATSARTNPPDDMSEEERFFWANFRDDKDVYVQMLRNAWYASFYLGAVPRLDIEKLLPRNELLIPCSTEESGEFPVRVVENHLNNFLRAMRLTGFEVSDEHSMFANEAKIDILPSLLIKVHDTVKIWATELLSRVQEYIGYHLSRAAQVSKLTGVRVRPWRRAELEAWATQLQHERDQQAGMGKEPRRPMLVDDSQGGSDVG